MKMNLVLTTFVFIFFASSTYAKPLGFMKNQKDLSLDEAQKIITCQPVTISESGPLSSLSEKYKKLAKELTISFGAYKFSRTDVGNPDGELKVYHKNKLICDIETSILSRIKFLPNSHVVLLKWSSGCGSNWEIFQTEGQCKSVGLISDKDSVAFETTISQLKKCE